MNQEVTVMMSTYNGEKYIIDQIESILNQKDVRVKLLIRDDGSKDKSIEIIKEFERKDNRVKFYTGENLGPAYSFLNLLSESVKFTKSNYYAFSDQDDVWDDDKMSIAINRLENLEKDKPLLYYSNLKVVDANLSFIRMAHNCRQEQSNKYSALVEYMPSGCTMVFNKRVVELVNSYKPSYCFMHDTWIYVLCKIFGETTYDFEGHIAYRQHGNNVIGTYSKRSLHVYIDRIQRVFDRKQQPKYYTARCLYSGYKKYMNEQDLQVVEEIINYKKNISNRIRLLFDNRIKATNISRDLRNRLLIIAGIL